MPAGQARCYTGRVHGGIINGIFGESRHRVHVGRSLQYRQHIGRALALFCSSFFLIIGASDVVQLERKLITLQTSQSIAEMVDSIVRRGNRAVPARIRDRELIICVQLFSSINLHHQRPAMIHQNAATIMVQHELGIDQVAVVLEQPVDPV